VNQSCKFTRAAALLGLSLAFVGCASKDAPAQDCDLPPASDVVFTRVQLDARFSSPLCPDVVAADLNDALADAGASACDTVVNGCNLLVECDFDVAQGRGSLTYKNGEFTGFMEVTDPIECSYAVTAVER
jgi:hypothetical protein